MVISDQILGFSFVKTWNLFTLVYYKDFQNIT